MQAAPILSLPTLAAIGSGIAVLAVIMIPSCVRAIRLSRTAEATEYLGKLRVAWSDKVDLPLASVPLTPGKVPAGAPSTDPPGTWAHPTWKALEFSIEEPHWFSYAIDFERTPAQIEAAFRAQADLDGDGATSMLVLRARRPAGGSLVVDGLEVTNALE